MKTVDGFALVNGARLYFEITGEGAPVVLIHGFTLDCRMWDDQVEELARDYQVIRYDLRGFGQSSPPGEAYSHVHDLQALLAHLGVSRAAVLGLSMGGGIAVDFALACPQATRGLLLADSTLPGFVWSPETNGWSAAVALAVRRGGVEEARARWLAHPFFAPAREQPGVARRLARHSQRLFRVALDCTDDTQVAAVPSPPALESISAPCARGGRRARYSRLQSRLRCSWRGKYLTRSKPSCLVSVTCRIWRVRSASTRSVLGFLDDLEQPLD